MAPLAVALAWVRDAPGVTAPVVGARTAAQLRASLEADRVTLPAEIRGALDEVSAPATGSTRRLTEALAGWVHNGSPMAEWEYQHLYLPRGTSRGAARRLLTDHAEYGHWELARLRLFADGSRRVVLRRKVIRVVRTA